MPKKDLAIVKKMIDSFQNSLERNLMVLEVMNTPKVRLASIEAARDWMLQTILHAYMLGEDAANARHEKAKKK